MRRTIVLLTTMAMTLLVATSVSVSVAVADTVFCTEPPPTPCYGTVQADHMYGEEGGSTTFFALGGNDQVIAHRGDNSLHGGDGNDLLYGENGNDRMYGNAGDDFMGGYGGTDSAYFLDSPAAITASLATEFAEGHGSDTLEGLENLLGSKYNDRLFGSSVANTLYGYSGNDNLTGSAGKDSLYGASGNDTIRAADSTADSRISCGPGSDTVYYDRNLDVLGLDCEKRIPYPLAAPTN